MRFVVIILIMAFLESISYCQERAMVWYFGDHVGVDFNSGEPLVLTDGALKAEAGCASICDVDGNLLFYTNGIKVWNRNHQVMTNGDSLNGSQLVNQNSVIVPKPLSNSNYYLFTLNNYDTLRGFNYSVVDMNMENGLGKIIEKNTQVSINVLEKIAAVEHCNMQDYWIITHGYNNDFYSYLVTDIAVIADTVISNVGTPPKADIGYLKVSPAGNKLVMPINNDSILVEILKFDNRTGEIYQPIKITLIDDYTYAYGIEFSPDGNMLYISTGGSSYDIWQYNLRIEDEAIINNSAIHIASGNNFAMQLAPDHSIYIASENRPKLNGINKPNLIGEDCNYEQDIVTFTQGTSLMGLPNFVQTWFYEPSFDVEDTCYLDSTLFTFYQHQNVDSVNWKFNDDSTAVSVGVDDFSIIHIFQDTGSYSVELNIFHCGIIETITKVVDIFPYPKPNLVPDTTICINCNIILDAGSNFDSYLWNNGSTDRYLTIYDAGVYFVEIGKNGCYSTDTTIIRKSTPAIFLPNAFTPNGDGINDEFKVINPNNFVDFRMWIQNRNGNTVYSNNNAYEGWDGMYLGQPCYKGTFVWNIKYSYYNETGTLSEEVKRGVVTIIK